MPSSMGFAERPRASAVEPDRGCSGCAARSPRRCAGTARCPQVGAVHRVRSQKSCRRRCHACRRPRRTPRRRSGRPSCDHGEVHVAVVPDGDVRTPAAVSQGSPRESPVAAAADEAPPVDPDPERAAVLAVGELPHAGAERTWRRIFWCPRSNVSSTSYRFRSAVSAGHHSLGFVRRQDG